MRQYVDLVKKVLNEGTARQDRTGVGTISLFGESLSFDLTQGFPLLTVKKVNFAAVVEELLWFLRGETNIKTLKSKIWDEWADENGSVGYLYGYQWRHLQDPRSLGGDSLPKPIDQIKNLIDGLLKNQNDRGHIVSAWNVRDLPYMRLRPCHAFFQCYVREQECDCGFCDFKYKYIDLQMYQRSADLGLGVPFNIASYALLNHLICSTLNSLSNPHTNGKPVYIPGKLKICFGDVHVYMNHKDKLSAIMDREPFNPPHLVLSNGTMSIRTIEDTKIINPKWIEVCYYSHWPAISLPVAV